MKRILIVLLMAVSITAAGQRYGVTNFSASYLRLNADYEAPLETQELMGIVVKIEESSGYWLKITSPQSYTAWCTNKAVVEMTTNEIEAYLAAPKYIVTAFSSKVTEQADTRSQMISDLVQGDILRMALVCDNKGQLVVEKCRKGFVKVLLPDGRSGFVAQQDVCELKSWASGHKESTQNICTTACNYLGIPYLWGGMSTKGFDCSGFVRHVYLMNGIVLPRNASQQAGYGIEVSDMSKLKAGDLLFFGQKANMLKKEKITHVGIYLGNGKFIHSSQVVRINSLNEKDSDYYENAGKLVKVRRITGTDQARKLNVRFHSYLPVN